VAVFGPILSVNPHFRVLRVAPAGRGGLWQYVSVGTVYYHRPGRLGLGHTLPIGEPWLPESACDHWLVSLPYPFGPDLQTCHGGSWP
jgi:hypothetical protein